VGAARESTGSVAADRHRHEEITVAFLISILTDIAVAT